LSCRRLCDCVVMMMVSFCAVRLELEENAEDVDVNFNCNRSIEVSLINHLTAISTTSLK
jgi:hypothetical protein